MEENCGCVERCSIGEIVVFIEGDIGRNNSRDSRGTVFIFLYRSSVVFDEEIHRELDYFKRGTVSFGFLYYLLERKEEVLEIEKLTLLFVLENVVLKYLIVAVNLLVNSLTKF